jgi:transcriptional regulator with XRE-family HTH domain
MATTFAERLRELRQAADLTQEGLAEASGVPLPSVRGYEQGQREPYWHAYNKLLKALGVSADAFADCVSKDGDKGLAKTGPKRQRPALPRRPRGRPKREK